MAPILSEEEAALDPYALLGLSPEATSNDALKAFRKMSLKYHPDKNSAPEAAVMFHQISLSLGVFQDQAKRNYLDTKLSQDRKKKERYMEMDKKRKDMVDALVAREEEAKRAKMEGIKRRQQETQEEAIKDAGRRMLEEAQKRALDAASAAARPPPKVQPPLAASMQPQGVYETDERMPEISSEDLTLILTLPATSATTSTSLEISLTKSYGQIAHLILPPPPIDGETKGTKKKPKARKAVVEFAQRNWGGCFACFRDLEAGKTEALSLPEGTVKVKWVKGEAPAWISWAEKRMGRGEKRKREGSDPNDNGRAPPLSSTIPSPLSSSSPTAATSANAPSFSSFPNLPSSSNNPLADLIASHEKEKNARVAEKAKREEYESVTLNVMRMMEREKMEQEIRRMEEEEE